MRELYEGLGAFVVDGGETFNPSIYDLLAAIHEVPAEEVLVFPNNPNVVMAAERAGRALRQAGPGGPLHLAAGRGGRAGRARPDRLASTRTPSGWSTRSPGSAPGRSRPPRATTPRAGSCKGDAVGFVGDEIVAWGGAGSTLDETMASLAEGAEILTVIGGEGAPIALAELEGHAPGRGRARAPRGRPAALLVAAGGTVT